MRPEGKRACYSFSVRAEPKMEAYIAKKQKLENEQSK